MKRCAHCGDADQRDDAVFCDICRHRFDEPARPPLRTPAMTPTPMHSALPQTKPAGTCPNCGNVVLPGAAYCERCRTPLQAAAIPSPSFPTPQAGGLPATRLSLSCAACGAALSPDQRYCSHCGGKPAASPAPEKATDLLDDEGAGASVTGPRLVTTSGTAFALKRGELVIGRDDPGGRGRPAVNLGPHGGEAGGVSRQHARLVMRDGRWTIEDLNSMNYTYVNNRKLAPHEPCVLQHGDQIRVGRLVLTYFGH